MSPRVLSSLSSICFWIAMALTYCIFRGTLRGSLLWYLQGFSSVFLWGYWLCSAYSTKWPITQSTRSKKFLLAGSALALVLALMSTADKFAEEQQRQSQE